MVVKYIRRGVSKTLRRRRLRNENTKLRKEISKLKTKMKPYKKKADKFNAQIEKRENKKRSNNREILK